MTSFASSRAPYLTAGAIFVAFLLWIAKGHSRAADVRVQQAVFGAVKLRCDAQFIRYVPSLWETRWRDQREALAPKICATMLQQTDLSDRWMRGMQPFLDPHMEVSPAMLGDVLADDEVWSRYEYKDSCTGTVVSVPIEPLVGLMRHPIGHASCAPSDGSLEWSADLIQDPPPQRPFRHHIENKGYLLITPHVPEYIAAQYPGRKYLFDLGTGVYSSGSLPWLLTSYEQRGIIFDEIWGWEAKESPVEQYWRDWPAKDKFRMHYYNTPYDSNHDSTDFPLNIMRRVYKPGDFVVIKLDIDTEVLELDFMRAIEKDQLSSIIAEIFWEQHYNAPEMEKYFLSKMEANWTDSVELFQKLRSQGLRLHYWP